MTIDEMIKAGLRPRTAGFLTVMEWPDPFTTMPWTEIELPVRSLRDTLGEQFDVSSLVRTIAPFPPLTRETRKT